jgi:hypothetical protein
LELLEQHWRLLQAGQQLMVHATAQVQQPLPFQVW